MKVLVIDDNLVMIEMMKKFLELEDFDVKVINNPALAVETITNNEFDKIILDLAMPEVSGMDILNSLPSDFPKNKFLIMTASSITDDFEQELKKTGISAVLRKPVSMNVLTETLKSH